MLVDCCLDVIAQYNTTKIMKLASFGVCAIRATSKNGNRVDVEKGNYRLVSDMSDSSNACMYVAITVGSYLLVFMSPETAISNPWRELFGRPHFQSRLVLVAVNEAHCISE